MKNIILFSFIILITSSLYSQSSDFYSLKIKTLEGADFDFATLRGKKVLLVNTASKCGFTPQYEQLQELNQKYGGENFVIIGFPSNDFLKQEPGTASEIRSFCTSKYNVTFILTQKIDVKGKNQHDVYKWLTKKKLNGEFNSKVKWNFQKYLVDENGKLIAVFAPSVKPMSDEIVSKISGK